MTMHTPRPGRFIDPFTDFGFKRIFGSEPNKDLLIDFLNALLAGERVITDLTYDKTEQNGTLPGDRKVIFDLLCKGIDGEQFIIEMQRIRQDYFKDRCLYYVSSLIRDQVPVSLSKWNYLLKPVYLIGIMDFCFDDASDHDFIHRISLRYPSGEIFYNKLGFVYVEIPRFNKEEEQLCSSMDNWLFLLKHMNELDKLPLFLRKPVFEKLFEIAEVSNLTKEEKMAYDASLKQQRDWYATTESLLNEGERKGIEEGILLAKLETARKMKAKGLHEDLIRELTGLSVEEVKNA